MNSIFDAVKAAVSVPEAAAYYGLAADHAGLVRCLFHADRHPSMKLYTDHFYCFGCHTCGDVITLTGQLFGLSPLEAARKLRADFGSPPPGEARVKPLPRVKQNAETVTRIRLLCDYEAQLKRWKAEYAPEDPESMVLDWHFTFACHELPWVEYMNDCLLSADPADREQAEKELEDHRFTEKISFLLSAGREEAGHGRDRQHAS